MISEAERLLATLELCVEDAWENGQPIPPADLFIVTRDRVEIIPQRAIQTLTELDTFPARIGATVSALLMTRGVGDHERGISGVGIVLRASHDIAYDEDGVPVTVENDAGQHRIGLSVRELPPLAPNEPPDDQNLALIAVVTEDEAYGALGIRNPADALADSELDGEATWTRLTGPELGGPTADAVRRAYELINYQKERTPNQ